jgi:hypothetical protein
MSTAPQQTLDSILANKGANRIQVNNILSAICLAALSVLLGTGEHITPWAIGQLAMAIPLLVSSSLAYAKLCYRSDEWWYWDTLGWFTHSAGYLMILNATFLLMARKGYPDTAYLFLGVSVGTFVLYSLVDAVLKPHRWLEKTWKLLLHVSALFAGSLLPLLAGWA